MRRRTLITWRLDVRGSSIEASKIVDPWPHDSKLADLLRKRRRFLQSPPARPRVSLARPAAKINIDRASSAAEEGSGTAAVSATVT